MDQSTCAKDSLVVYGSGVGYKVFLDQGTVRGRFALNITFILDPDGQAFQSTCALANSIFALSFLSAVAGFIKVFERERIDDRFCFFDPLQHSVKQFDR